MVRRTTKEYQVWVEINRDWYPMTQFDEIEEAVSWMASYDPDGSIPMQLKNLWEHRQVDLIEWRRRNPKQKEKKEKKDWKNEGF